MIWTHPHKLLLASGSETRRLLLEEVSIPVDVKKPDVDERLIESQSPWTSTAELAIVLAEAKSKSVSVAHPHRIVIGADQVLDFDGTVLHKQQNRIELTNQLLRMQGRSHTLYSAVAISCNGAIVCSFSESVTLKMKCLTENLIIDYVENSISKNIFSSVGGYQFEDIGAALFSGVKGDYSAILGIPIRRIIGYFNSKNLVVF